MEEGRASLGALFCSFTIGSNIVVRATELPKPRGSEDAEEALRSFPGDVLLLGELEEGRGLLATEGEEGEDFLSLLCSGITLSASDQSVGASSPIFSNSIATGDSIVRGIVNKEGDENDDGEGDDAEFGVSGVGGTANFTDFSSAPKATTPEGLPIKEVRPLGSGATEETRRKSGFKAASPRRAGVANRSNRELSNDSR